MDFSLPHIHTPSVATNSTIRHIPVPGTVEESHLGKEEKKKDQNNSTSSKEGDENDFYYHNLSSDDKLNVAANNAAADLFLGPPQVVRNVVASDSNTTITAPSNFYDPERRSAMINADAYPERSMPQSQLIGPGALVVMFESFDNLNFCYVAPGEIFSNRNGHFHHDDFIGKPFGSKIRSRNNRGYGYVHLLKPTPELWARSLNHRTQIIHELDSSMIVFYLNLRPNMVVCESGTGSGALSHAIMRCIAPHGLLHTYEFNGMRASTARTEFAKNGLSHLVKVYHRDVCGKQTKNNTKEEKKEIEGEKPDNQREKHDDDELNKCNIKIHELSETDEDNGSGGFQRRSGSVDAVILDLPEPWEAVRHAAVVLKLGGGRIASYSPCVEQTQRTVGALSKYGFHSIQTKEFRLKEYYVDELEYDCSLPQTKRPRFVDPRFNRSHNKTNGGRNEASDSGDKKLKDGSVEINGDEKKNSGTKPEASSSNPSSSTRKTKRHLVARPFGTMRGHTAFLTFATRSNLPSSSLPP
mmetsp:Transcript_29024/g.70047  ORF Transcript_29024/g.70047 Transcript_29024/m.70047 type:complete len:525 (+) Transcript_29024:46-1620(+)